MRINVLISIVAFVLEILDLIWFFIRAKKHGLVSKDQITKDFLIKVIFIYICVIALPVICIFIYFGLAGNIILCGCGVLGLEIANKDFLVKPEDE